MKAKTGTQVAQAVRVFTDREEPRAAFWKQYRLLEQELQTQLSTGEICDVHVLSYYGIGGIGKSTLLKKICQEMQEQIASPIYALYNFENGSQDSRRVLERLRTRLMEKAKFVFPLFDLGLYMYAQKMGEPTDSPEAKQFTSQSPLLSLVLSVLEFIPKLDYLPKILNLVEKSKALYSNHVKKHKNELARMQYMEPEELYAYLPTLFSLDMQHNLEKATQPVVIFLDTYEKLVNEMSQVGIPLKNDEWIRGENGIVQNIPGVLWVIAGREKLKWVQFDPEWDSSLEQHILGNLSITDSTQFLETAGVGGPQLREQLYQLTQGTPVYLDLCVDQFMRIAQKGETPEISMFGGNIDDLIERFVRYMTDAQKDNVYMLSCLQSWTSELVSDIAGKILPNFSITSYNRTKEYSFISLGDDGTYSMHQTVGSVLLKDCPDELKARVGTALLEKYLPVVRKKAYATQAFADALIYITRAALLLHKDREALDAFLQEHIWDTLTDYIAAGQYQQGKLVLDLLSDRCNEQRNDLLFGRYLTLVAYYLHQRGLFREALEHRKTVYDVYVSVLGEASPQTLQAFSRYIQSLITLAMRQEALEASAQLVALCKEHLPKDDSIYLSALRQQANLLSDDGKYLDALPIIQDVYRRQKALSGEDSLEMVRISLDLSMILGRTGRYQEAYDFARSAYDNLCRILGPEHPNTLRAQQGLASILGRQRRYQESLEMNQDLLEKRRKVMGNDHPATVAILHNIAANLASLKKYADALDLEYEALEMYRRYYGDEHPKALQAMSNIAINLRRLNRHEESIQRLDELLELRNRILGENHPDTLMTHHSLAVTLNEKKETAAALSHSIIAVEGLSKAVGKNHPHTLMVKNYYGRLLAQTGDYEHAISTIEETLSARRRALKKDHPDILAAISNLATVCRKCNKLDRAAALYEELYHSYCRTEGKNCEKALEALEWLLVTMEEGNHFQNLLPWYDKLLQARTEILGPEHPDTITARSKRGIVYCRLRQYAKALPEFETVLEVRRKLFGDEDPLTINTVNNLANAYAGLGNREKALELFNLVLESRRRILGDEHSETLFTMHNIALTYQDEREYEKAQSVLEELLAIYRRIGQDDTVNAYSVILSLGVNLHNLKQPEDAMALYQTALAGFRKLLPAGHSKILVTLGNLAMLLAAQGKHEEALPLKQEVLEYRRKNFGATHPLTIDATKNLIYTLQALGQTLEAQKLQLQLQLLSMNQKKPETET